MALREFRDGKGIAWRVWATTPNGMYSLTVGDSTLGELRDGWLTFECADERRRLAPFPADWDTLTDVELERCCTEAKAPPPRRPRTRDVQAEAEGRAPAPAGSATTPLDALAPTRTFAGTSGRLWRVAEHIENVGEDSADEVTRSGGTRYYLRFTSDSDVLELDTYPMAWARLPDAQLLKLARQARFVSGGAGAAPDAANEEEARIPER